jgi:hypothetical protein
MRNKVTLLNAWLVQQYPILDSYELNGLLLTGVWVAVEFRHLGAVDGMSMREERNLETHGFVEEIDIMGILT